MFCVFKEFVDHGGRQGNAAQALTQWQHPLASSEARNVLHRAMRSASHRRIRMAIEIVSIWRVFFVAVVYVVGCNHSKIT